MSEPPHLCTRHERATKFSVESVWKCQGLLLSAHMTGRVRWHPPSVLNQSEMSGPLPPSTPDRKGERATKFSLESDLNQFWIGYESVLNQIRICFDLDLKCTSFLSQSIANYQEMASRFPGNTSMAFNLCPKESYSGNRGSYWPPTQVFPKNEADIFLELKA